MDFQQIRDFVNPAVAQATGLQEVDNLQMPVPVAYVPVQIVIDGALSLTSENPVQNKVIAVAIQNLDGRITAIEGQFSEGVTEAVNNWLAAHPEATTTVQDGAITYAKLDTNLKAEVDQISDLKSAITQKTRNLVQGILQDATIEGNSYIYHTTGADVVYAPVESGKTYYVTSGEGRIVAGFYTDVPQFGSSAYDGVRIVQNALTITAPINGYIAFRTTSGYLYNQITEGTENTAYIPPVSATDFVAREEIDSLNNTLQNKTVKVELGAQSIDFNDVSQNSVIRFANSQNSPASEGTLLFVGSSVDTGFQIVIDRNGKTFHRQKWGNWGNWLEVLSRADVMFVHSGSTQVDLDLLENNSIYRVAQGSTNVPLNETEGTVMTFGSTTDTSVQFFISRYGVFYHRVKWGTWGNWIAEAAENIIKEVNNKRNILTAFSNITCVGDSLTWSQVYTSASTQRQAYNTYPHCIEKLTGTPTTFFATPGFTTAQWWATYSNNIEQKSNQLAIIYLGNNGGLTDTLEQDAPENVDYSQYANTNTGCYAKIISKFKEYGAKVVLVKVYDVNQTTNNVISECGERFGCAVVDNEKLGNIYRTYPDGTGVNPIHYNDLGYAQFATELITKIAQLNDNMLGRILPV